LAKQLRLEVAELTDIGRRREINEDSVTLVVPKDGRDMERKGALFVVADGMGGHAAGEVASEMAVELIREHYYADPVTDVLESLSRAIKTANDAIFRRASELAGRAGMGTTCVAAVLKGGVAYVMNVGDSRAYLVRNGLMKLVTQDHSWVAEQVRAGMLTEDQARIHVHRHVITRALGTQPDVEPDIFVEPLQEGDVLLLCSDGLSGYVSDLDINTIVNSADPQRSVRELINRANEHGGPDNITAIVVQVLEVPPLSSEVKDHLRKIDPSREQTIVLETAHSPRVARLRTVMAVLAAAILVALLVGATGPQLRVYLAGRQLSDDVAQAQTFVDQAKHQPPVRALPLLARAQQQVQHALELPASSSARAHAEQVLADSVVPAVRQAIQSYNQAAHITALARVTHTAYPVICPAAGESLQQIAVTETTVVTVPEKTAIPKTTTPKTSATGSSSTQTRTVAGTVYVRDGGNVVYPMQFIGANAVCGTPISASGVVDMAVDGSVLYLLTRSPTGQYAVQELPAGKQQPTTLLSLPTDLSGVPAALDVRNGNVYILLRSTVLGQDSLLLYPGPQPKASVMQTILHGASVRSMAVGNDGDVYLLLQDGTFVVLENGQVGHSLDVQVMPPLGVSDPSQFTAAMPVPTPVPPAGTPGNGANELAQASTVAADQSAMPQVVVSDGTRHRIILLQAGDGGSTIALRQQLVDRHLLAHLRDVAVSADGHAIYVLTNTSLIEVLLAPH